MCRRISDKLKKNKGKRQKKIMRRRGGVPRRETTCRSPMMRLRLQYYCTCSSAVAM